LVHARRCELRSWEVVIQDAIGARSFVRQLDDDGPCFACCQPGSGRTPFSLLARVPLFQQFLGELTPPKSQPAGLLISVRSNLSGLPGTRWCVEVTIRTLSDCFKHPSAASAKIFGASFGGTLTRAFARRGECSLSRNRCAARRKMDDWGEYTPAVRAIPSHAPKRTAASPRRKGVASVRTSEQSTRRASASHGNAESSAEQPECGPRNPFAI
jgi:hypothetical protein